MAHSRSFERGLLPTTSRKKTLSPPRTKDDDEHENEPNFGIWVRFRANLFCHETNIVATIVTFRRDGPGARIGHRGQNYAYGYSSP